MNKQSLEQWISQLDEEGYCDISDKQVEALIRGLVALDEQRDALAAENAALKSYLPQPQGAAMMEALDAFYCQEDVPEQGMMAAFEILCCKRPQTPATDAFIAEQRAQGVEMFSEQQRSFIGKPSKNDAASSYCSREAIKFADQLRQGGAV